MFSSVAKMTPKLIVLTCLLAAANARSVSTFTSRIVGGHDAKPGEFPHQISIQFKNPEEEILYFEHLCGGSILNDRWIISAAHCVYLLEDPEVIFVVRAGKHDLNSTEGSEQISRIDRVFVHEKYDKKSESHVSPYDIGLIKLKDTLRLNKRVAPVSLPEKNSEPTGKVTVSGWGYINDDVMDPKEPAILQTVDLEIIDRDACNKAVHEFEVEEGKLAPNDLVDESNVCTGPVSGGGVSPCHGDSGGPLISKNSNGKTELVGVVSWGIEPCGVAGTPSVYVRTSFFVDWIENIMSKK